VNIHEETERCLGCDLVCNKCTEVCPNRANVAIRVKSGFLENYYQIVHLDQLCNECGNCETFCPWQGKPYKDKFTLYSSSESFLSGTNSGVFYENDKNGQVRELEIIGRFRISENNFYVEDDKGEEANLRPETVAVIKTLARNYQYLTGLREDDI
jgi:putative selenate reductase